tara:strand:- start:539 stop:865 length:327 start_codon:yes stop_codon:yes gene_type:complete
MNKPEIKTLYIENFGDVVIPPLNTKEDIINIVNRLSDYPEFIKEFLEILPDSKIKTVYIENFGNVVIPPRNTKEDILNIVNRLSNYPEFIKEFLEILPNSLKKSRSNY